MKLLLAQLNPTVGDTNGNLNKIKEAIDLSIDSGVDLIIFSELFVTGYPPRDLLDKKWFIERTLNAVKTIKTLSTNIESGILIGVPLPSDKDFGLGLYNSAILIHKGEIVFQQNKSLLPVYDVFDEARYFDQAQNIEVFTFKNFKLGISICEDAWNSSELWGRKIYNFDPIETLVKKGAQILINISASPFFIGKEQIRQKIISNHVTKHKLPFIFLNQIGGNDELIFDGRSFVLNQDNKIVAMLPAFQEKLQIVDLNSQDFTQFEAQDEVESLYQALTLGVKDYLHKCGFKDAIIGLSGGIDSAVTAALAVNALGKDHVIGVMMPSRYSSKGSIDDSIKLAKALNINYQIIPINDIFEEFIKSLNPHFNNLPPDTTEENIQARIRGNILMALSNKFNSLVLSTGNKSELAVGYCTLYGDMSGGLAVISDIPKITVYQLAHYINRNTEIIPNEIIQKAPSAELRANQKDQDTLPPYDILDEILKNYIEDGLSEDDIVQLGFSKEIVKWVVATVNRNEYKRKQAAPGLKVTPKAFGMGRRMPIAARY